MRVVIAEDEALLRQGLALVLEQDGFEVVSAVGTAAELEDAVGEHQPQLVITDIRMPPTFTDEGLVAAHRIRASSPDVAIVVLSQHDHSRAAALAPGKAVGAAVEGVAAAARRCHPRGSEAEAERRQ